MSARPVPRPRGHRTPKTRILVVCQGAETEPNYFDGLKREQIVRDRFSVRIVSTKGGTALDIVEKAGREADDANSHGKEYAFEEVWCVIDVEQPGRNPQLADACRLAEKEGFHVALSNPAFEVWILAHFERTAKSFLDCRQVIACLNGHWRSAFGQEYDKTDQNIYRHLADRVGDAVDNAKSVREMDFRAEPDTSRCNSSTEVYRLVESLGFRPVH